MQLIPFDAFIPQLITGVPLLPILFLDGGGGEAGGVAQDDEDPAWLREGPVKAAAGDSNCGLNAQDRVMRVLQNGKEGQRGSSEPI
eukprot:scaffold226821_cov19-Tisochrysis_lutea.AAC.1